MHWWAGTCRTLQRIYAHMKMETQISWRNRFLRKASIEQALIEFNSELDEAAQSFQVTQVMFNASEIPHPLLIDCGSH